MGSENARYCFSTFMYSTARRRWAPCKRRLASFHDDDDDDDDLKVTDQVAGNENDGV